MVGYLGPQGSYSYLAAKELCPESELCEYANFSLLVRALERGECDKIVLPIENTLNGGVLQNLDLLYETESLYAYRECIMRIEHRLIVREGGDFTHIDRVFSHRQAIEQCSRYLTEHFPASERVFTDSTAGGVDRLEKPTDAGIVGAHFQRDGFRLSDFSVSDEPNNFTHFLLVGKEKVRKPTKHVFFAAAMQHEPGSLVKLLSILHVYGKNMTRIESRPNKVSPGEYVFFIEAEADICDRRTCAMLDLIEETSLHYKLLGAY